MFHKGVAVPEQKTDTFDGSDIYSVSGNVSVFSLAETGRRIYLLIACGELESLCFFCCLSALIMSISRGLGCAKAH